MKYLFRMDNMASRSRMYGMIWIIMAMLCMAEQQDDHNESVIIKDKGLILKRDGWIGLDVGVKLMSVFLKFQNPYRDYHPCYDGCGLPLNELTSTYSSKKDTCVKKRIVYDEQSVKPDYSHQYESHNDEQDEIDCIYRCIKTPECNYWSKRKQDTEVTCDLWNNDPVIQTGFKLGSSGHISCLIGSNRTNYCYEKQSTEAKLFQQINENYVSKIWQEKLLELGDRENKKRTKRGVGTVLFGVLSFAAAGYSTYQTWNMKKHVDELQKEFTEFKQTQIERYQEEVIFRKKTIQIIQQLQSETQEQLRNLDCKNRELTFQAIYKYKMNLWIRLLDQVITGSSIKGERDITANIVKPEWALKLIREDGSLNSSLMMNNPSLFYKLSSQHIVDANFDGKQVNVHLILRVPIIKQNQITPLYTVHQVGLYAKQCMNLKLPRNIYKHEGKYMLPNSLDNCETLGSLKLCNKANTAISFAATECLNGDLTQCEMTPDDCDTKFIESMSGILVRTNDKIRAIPKNGSRMMTIVSKPKNPEISYISFNEYDSIIFDDMLFTSPDEPALEEVINIPIDPAWENFTRAEGDMMIPLNVSELNDLIGKTQAFLYGEEVEHLTKILAWISMALWIAYFTKLLFGCIMKACRSKMEVWIAAKELEESGIFDVENKEYKTRLLGLIKNKLTKKTKRNQKIKMSSLTGSHASLKTPRRKSDRSETSVEGNAYTALLPTESQLSDSGDDIRRDIERKER